MCDSVLMDDYQEEYDMPTENYLKLFGAAWDDPDEAAEELEDGVI